LTKIFISNIGYGDANVFIGIDKRGQSNFSKWDNGKPLTYTDWEVNGVDGPSTQHCVIAL
jgi:hypothetical protein